MLHPRRPLESLYALALFAMALAMTPSLARGAEPPDLFVRPQAKDSLLKPVESRLWKAIQERPTTAEAVLIRLANLDRLGRAMPVRLALPGWLDVTLEKARVERRSARDFSYFATGTDGAEVMLVVQDGTVTGTIHVGDQVFQVEPLGRGQHVLRRFDPMALPGDEVELGSAWSDPAAEAYDSVPPALGNHLKIWTPPMMKVLVAYTPAVAALSANVGALIQSHVDQTNASFIDSDVSARVALVHTVQVSYTEFPSDHQTHLSRFRGASDGFMDNVHALRDLYEADLMVLLVDDGTNVVGRAAVYASAADAFATAHYDTLGSFTFAHELGHLAGNVHHNETATPPITYGYGLENLACGFRTIMAVTPSSVPRVKRWANPRLTYNGCGTGTTYKNDTARVWDERSPTMAAFRPSPPAVTVSVSAPSKACTPGDATASATPQARAGCTLGACTYGWRYLWCEGGGECPTRPYATGESGTTSTKYMNSYDVYVDWQAMVTCNVTCAGTTTSQMATGTRRVWGPAGFLCGGGF